MVSSHTRHHLPAAPGLPAGQVGLRLTDDRFRHDQTRRAVLNLRIYGDGLSCED